MIVVMTEEVVVTAVVETEEVAVIVVVEIGEDRKATSYEPCARNIPGSGLQLAAGSWQLA